MWLLSPSHPTWPDQDSAFGGLLGNPGHCERREDGMGCCSQLCRVVVGQRCMSHKAREGPSPTKPHDTSLATQTSAAWLMRLTNRALAAHKQLQSSAQILPWQSNTSCWGQAGVDITALPSVLPATPGQPWPSTSGFPESRSREQLDLFPPRVQQSCGSRF